MSIQGRFSDEEKRQLSYLGSMLSRPNAPFEEEVQEILDAEGIQEERDAGARRQNSVGNEEPPRT
jgi:hypothetical protein